MLPPGHALAIELELQNFLFKSEDAKEGLKSFTEKRTAKFKGK